MSDLCSLSNFILMFWKNDVVNRDFFFLDMPASVKWVYLKVFDTSIASADGGKTKLVSSRSESSLILVAV